MFILCQHQTEKVNLSVIKNTLNEFVIQTQQLYGKQTIRINIHQLLHIIDQDVEAWGLL